MLFAKPLLASAVQLLGSTPPDLTSHVPSPAWRLHLFDAKSSLRGEDADYGSMDKASRKSDVFSFGIMLLEVFIGKMPTDSMFAGELNLREWVHRAFPANCGSGHNNNPPSEASFSRLADLLVPIFELGLLCSRDAPDERLTMKDVVKLKSIRKDCAASAGREQRVQ